MFVDCLASAFAVMQRLKPLPQGFLASAAASHSPDRSPAKPAGESSNPRTFAKKRPSLSASTQNANSHSAIDSVPLPGQIVFSNRLSAGLSAAQTLSESPRNVTDSQIPTFYVKISATGLPQINGADIDPVCIVSQSNNRLHTTEVVFNDTDPDFNAALKLDASTNRAKPLELRIYDATNLQLDDALDSSGMPITDDDAKNVMVGERKGALLHESFVDFDSLATLIDNRDLNPSSSLIYKRTDQVRKSNIFLSLFPMEDDHLCVLQEDRSYLFELQDVSGADSDGVRATHDPVLDVIPWHLCTVQNAVSSINIRKKTPGVTEIVEADVMGLVLEAQKYKASCLGFKSAAELEHARMQPDFRCDVVSHCFTLLCCAGLF